MCVASLDIHFMNELVVDVVVVVTLGKIYQARQLLTIRSSLQKMGFLFFQASLP